MDSAKWHLMYISRKVLGHNLFSKEQGCLKKHYREYMPFSLSLNLKFHFKKTFKTGLNPLRDVNIHFYLLSKTAKCDAKREKHGNCGKTELQ